MDEQTRTRPDTFLRLITQKYGEVTFDVSLNGYREQIVNVRAPNPQDMVPAKFVDALAAASISKLGERSYEPDASNTDSKELGILIMDLTGEERELFASSFLACNNYLLSEFSETSNSMTDTVAKLHAAWIRKRKKDHKFAHQFIGSDIGSGLSTAVTKNLNHSLGILDSSSQYQSAVDQFTKMNSLSAIFGSHRSAIDQITKMNSLSTVLGSHRSAIDQITKMNSLSTVLGSHQSTIDQIAKMNSLSTVLGSHQSAIDQLTKMDLLLSKDLEVWRTLDRAASATLNTQAACSMFEAAIGSRWDRMAEKNLFRDTILASQLLAPSHAFTHFFEETSRMARESSSKLQSVFDTVLGFSAVHFGVSSIIVDRLIDDIHEDEIEVISLPDRNLDLFSLHRDEALKQAVRSPQATPASVVDGLELTQLATLVREVLTLVVDCNDASHIRLGAAIFSPTNRILRAAIELPQMVPVNRNELGAIIDDLFFILYEGAGDDKLRFLKKAGGVFDHDEALVEYVWHLKFLRNKWLRHDPEHGGEKKIQKTFAEVGQTFRALGLSGIPTAREHFIALYLRLLAGLRTFLQELLSRLGTLE